MGEIKERGEAQMHADDFARIHGELEQVLKDNPVCFTAGDFSAVFAQIKALPSSSNGLDISRKMPSFVVGPGRSLARS